jgi:hypothetical protein
MLLRAVLSGISMCLVLGALPKVARSDAPSDRLGAEALAEEARKLMARGEYEKGCVKYEESALLDETPARLIALANCHERQGKVATAWATLGEAADLAEARGDGPKLTLARETQKRLEPHIGRLKVIVPEEAQLYELVITRDGAPISSSLWGLAVAIDPGPHTIQVTAPGRQSWQVDIGLMPGPSTMLLRVPVLQADPEQLRINRERPLLDRRRSGEPAPNSLATGAFAATIDENPKREATRGSPRQRDPGETAPSDDSTGRSQRTIGLVLAGAGVTSLAVGTGFALAARSTHQELDTMCANRVCTAEGIALVDRGRAEAMRANVAFGLGLAALATGTVVYFLAPSPRPAQTGRVRVDPLFGPGTAALVATGQF